jgi:hypothetical protein
MSFNYSPKVVTNGLALCLDAANQRSYPGSGATWSDLTGNFRNSTLSNTPTYATGTLTFSTASLQYGTISNIGSLSNWTAEAWVKFNSTTTNQVSSVVGNQYNGLSSLNFSIGTNNSPSSYNICVGFYDGSWRNTTGFAPVVDTWYQIVGTYDGSTIRQYVNGVANGGTLNYVGTPTSGGEIRLMRRWDNVVSAGNLFNGVLSIVRVYNKALSSAEVLQNYNATKTRFGL